MISIEEALEKFKNSAPEAVLTIDSDWVAGLLNVVEAKYQIVLSPLVVFWAVGELKIDKIKDYLQSELMLDEKTAGSAESEIQEQILKPIARRLLFLDASPNKTNITMGEEKIIVLEILRQNLKEILGGHPIIANAINKRIFTILSYDESFFGQMEKALYDNQEKITTKTLTTNQKAVPATVANWLADFISRNSTGFFTTLALTQYMINSENVKRLSNVEKEMIVKLMLLYRNLKFFDQVFNEVPAERWEIIPLRLNQAKTVEPVAEKVDDEGMTELEKRAFRE